MLHGIACVALLVSGHSCSSRAYGSETTSSRLGGVGRIESAFKARSYLPEDEETILQAQDLGAIRARVSGIHDGENGFLPFLVDLCILQFHTSRSVDQTVGVLNSSLDLMSHRLDLRYTTLRYLSWVIPTIGFASMWPKFIALWNKTERIAT